jgi:hypothetical protein
MTELTFDPSIELAQHAAGARQRVVADVIEIGRRLTESKKICGHGNWLPWLDREFNWQEQTARNFIRFSRCHSNPQTLGICTRRSVASICSPQDLASAIQ